MKYLNLYLIASCILLFSACDPIIDDKLDIGAPPQANFSVEVIDANNVRFTNTTSDQHFITNWDFGSLGVMTENVVEMNFPFAGDYPVTLTVFGQGGSGSSTQTINIAQDDPNACLPLQQFFTNCGTETWGLSPEAGALWVGPTDNSQTWWSSTAGDVSLRDCDWNDDYVFSSDGSFVYDSKGDLWGESYMGFSSDGCANTSDLPADRAAWGDGNHTFELIEATANTPPQIKVIGNGAFLGLRKPANTGEVNFPQNEITYDVINMINGSPKKVELEVNFGGGIWRFILATK